MYSTTKKNILVVLLIVDINSHKFFLDDIYVHSFSIAHTVHSTR